MMETGVTIQAGSLLLAGLFERKSNSQAVVVTHPHPLYGGDMNNVVVETITRVYASRGFTTLRFNFRGVGASTGIHDSGGGERDDVQAAINFLLTSGMDDIHLSGYSFGAWVNSCMDNIPKEVKAIIAVSPPVAFLDYSKARRTSLLRYVISGRSDDFAPPEIIEEYLTGCGSKPQFDCIDNCDHFYSGCFLRLEDLLGAYIDNYLSTSPKS